jgi:hypothetical protein
MLGWWLPENVSTYGASVFHLIYWASVLGLIVAQALMARARRRARSRSHPLLEMMWAVVPALILVWLGLVSQHPAHEFLGGRPQIAFERAKDAHR